MEYDLQLSTPELPWTWSVDMDGDASCVGVSNDGRRVAAGNQWGALRCFDEAGTLLWEADVTEGVSPRRAYAVGLSPDGRLVVAARSDGAIQCYDEDGTLAWETTTRNRHGRPAFASDGRHVVVSPGILLAADGRLVAEVAGVGQVLAENHTGYLTALRDNANTIGFYEWNGRQVWSSSVKDMPGPAAISDDGERIAFAKESGKAICRSRSGKQLWAVSVKDETFMGRISEDITAISLGPAGGRSLVTVEEEFERSTGRVVAVDKDGAQLWKRRIEVTPCFLHWSEAGRVGFAGGYVHTWVFDAEGRTLGRMGRGGIELHVGMPSSGRALVGVTEHTVGYLKL